ncbi:MAG: hypothetical protein R2880_18610 [Deinococcales bacterium]
MSRGQYVEFGDVGHGVINISDCANQVISILLLRPGKGVDSDCVGGEGLSSL